jgi:hypothetical protein
MHTYLPVTLVITGMREEELKRLMLEIHRLPFLWSESGGQSYFCEIPIPLEFANEALLHIKRATASFEGRKKLSVVAAGDAMSFSIAPELFDEKSGRWTFEPEKSLKRIEAILLTAKNRGRSSH